jgi:uncharacterized protein YqjF (DUF2071 family)
MNPPLDRVAPTRRPPGRAAGHQQWRKLLFLHWAVPVDAVRACVPRTVALDLWEGQALVGVVPFEMRRIRPSWLPGPLGLDFLETNVRTYVHVGGEPGVHFFSLEASSRLAVAVARATFGLPYHHAQMTLRDDPGGEVTYRSRRRGTAGPRLEVRCRPGAPLPPSAPGTLQHFLIERYLLFVERSGLLHRAQVHHAPYPVHQVDVRSVEDELVAAAGLPTVNGPPLHAHWSPGVDVEVFAPAQVRGA